MSKKTILPQRKFVFASEGSRIELDVDAHADIDYDFFDSGAKAINKHELFSDQNKDHNKSRSSELKLVEKVDPKHKVGSNNHGTVDNVPSTKVDECVLNKEGTSNFSLGIRENVTGSKSNLNKGAGEFDVVVHRKDYPNNRKKSVTESTSLGNQYEQGDSQIEIDDGYKENKSDESIRTSLRPYLQETTQVGLRKKNLMNCIAYSSSTGNGTSKEEPFISCKKSQSEPSNMGTDSASSNTTSEITDVTSRTTSSCSLRKGVKVNDKIINGRPQQGNYNIRQSPARGMPMNLLVDPMRNMQIGLHEQRRDSRISSSTYLSKLSLGSSRSRILPARKNMSFTNDEMWRIERENESLLKKIEGKRNLHIKPQLTPANFNLSSSAINRKKVQMMIEQENQRLVKKLKSVRPVTDTSGPWRQVRH